MDSTELNRLGRGLSLLTLSNPKTMRGGLRNYLTAILHLAPAFESGFNTCPKHTPECAAGCLYFAGRGTMKKIQNARIRRTRLFFEAKSKFLDELHADLWLFKNYVESFGMLPAVRLNGTSDIMWEKHNVPQAWPGLIFYDYSKVLGRKNLPANYYLTFSFSGTNLNECQKALAQGMNVAVPFLNRPATWQGYEVLDGDVDDLRFLDKSSAILGLKAKGRLRRTPNSIFLGDAYA